MIKTFLIKINYCLELGLLDYPKIVQRPMDFDTLTKNLLNGKFATIEEFLADF